MTSDTLEYLKDRAAQHRRMSAYHRKGQEDEIKKLRELEPMIAELEAKHSDMIDITPRMIK